MRFKVGDKAMKFGGEYQYTGTIVAAFQNIKGADRYVLEADLLPGLLHIYSENNLQELPDDQETA